MALEAVIWAPSGDQLFNRTFGKRFLEEIGQNTYLRRLKKVEPGDFSKGAVIVVSKDQSVVFHILTDLSSDYYDVRRQGSYYPCDCRSLLALQGIGRQGPSKRPSRNLDADLAFSGVPSLHHSKSALCCQALRLLSIGHWERKLNPSHLRKEGISQRIPRYYTRTDLTHARGAA